LHRPVAPEDVIDEIVECGCSEVAGHVDQQPGGLGDRDTLDLGAVAIVQPSGLVDHAGELGCRSR
jgi:hypothetical protein